MNTIGRNTRTASIVKENGTVERLGRKPFDTKDYNEAWLQELIADNPYLIPSAEIGAQYSDLVCIGREVPVGAGENKGFIDNLYVTPTGNIVLVETKLWRNQEARRIVIAQIIDYAKEIRKWNSERLNNVAAEYTLKKFGQSSKIIDIMARLGYLSYSDEGELNTAISENLANASFLLMILGDGIRSGVREITEFLNENTSMSLELALVELEIYPYKSETFVVPNTIVKTEIIERQRTERFEQENKDSKYMDNQVLSRDEFLKIFAERNHLNPDEVISFIGTIEKVDGLEIGLTRTELTVRFIRENMQTSKALMTFGIGRGCAEIWVMPKRIKEPLLDSEKCVKAADEFLEFFKCFVDRSKCKSEPYERQEGFYYALVGRLFGNAKDVIASTKKFAYDLSQSR